MLFDFGWGEKSFLFEALADLHGTRGVAELVETSGSVLRARRSLLPVALEPEEGGHHRERRRQIELISRLLGGVPTFAGHLPGAVPLVESHERLGQRDLRLTRILAEAGTGAELEASRQPLPGAVVDVSEQSVVPLTSGERQRRAKPLPR